MSIDEISLSSAGSLCVAAIALFFFVFQGWFYLRRRELTENGWGALLSLSTAIYSAAVFVQFNAPQGHCNHMAEFFQFTAIVLLLHSLFGFTFANFQLDARRYHQVFGVVHVVIIGVMWFSDLIITDEFVHREFAWLSRPYSEPKLGVLGPLFMGYAAVAAVVPLYFWIRHRKSQRTGVKTLIIALVVWAALGVHDAVATLGVGPTVQFLMEYGFLAFSIAVLSITLRTYIHLYEEAESREERLAAEKERLDVTLRSIGEAFIATDAEGRIVLFNAAAERLSGRTFAQAVGQPIKEVIHSCYEERSEPVSGGSRLDWSRTSGAFKTLNGKRKHVSETRSLIHDHLGNVVGHVYILRDETERKLLQEQLMRSKKMEAIGVLAGGVAHDLNNILAGVASYPDVLLMQMPQDDKLRRPVETIKRTGEKAAAIVQDLLTMARRSVPTMETVDLNRVIKEFLKSPEYYNLRLHHEKVEVETDLDYDLHAVMGSPVQLSKSIMNLVTNAAEALPEGGKVLISTRHCNLEQTRAGSYERIEPGDYATVQITDTGVGISPADIEKIFEPFYTKKKMGRSGTGLGMPVVYGTVKDHGGFIDVKSRPGEGTTITLFLPATFKALKKRTTDKHASLEQLMGKGEAILVVDDMEEQREIASSMLTKLGYAATAVASGEEAVAYLQDNEVALLLLDLVMESGIDGLETLKQIRELHPEQRVVLASGYAETEKVKAAKEGGGYIKKPYSMVEVARAVREELDR